MKACIDFLILGPPKVGSTSLATMLVQHDNVSDCRQMIGHAEPFFWGRGVKDFGRKHIERYNKLFMEPGLKFEKTTTYFHNNLAPSRMKEWAREDLKFVCILRDPISRIESYSDHFSIAKHICNDSILWNKYITDGWIAKKTNIDAEKWRGNYKNINITLDWKDVFTDDFLRYITDKNTICESRPRLSVHWATKTRNEFNRPHDERQFQILVSDYSYNIKRWLEHYSLDQFLFIDYKDFRDDNPGTVTKILNFIGLTDIENFKCYHNNTNQQWRKWIDIPVTRHVPEKYKPYLVELYEYLNKDLYELTGTQFKF